MGQWQVGVATPPASKTCALVCGSIATLVALRRLRSWLSGDFRNARGERVPRQSLLSFAGSVLQRSWSPTLDPAAPLKMRERHGEIWQTPMNTMIASPELAKHVIVSNWPKVQFSAMKRSILMRRLMGRSLVSVDGGEWRAQKRVMSPAFHHAQLALLFEGIFRDAAAQLVRRWAAVCSAGPARVDAHDGMRRFTVDVIGRAAFSHDFKALSSEVGEVDPWLHALEEGLALVADPLNFVLPWLQHLPTPRNRRMKAHLAKLDELIASMLQQKRQRRSADTPPDLLDLILREQDGGAAVTDRALHDNVFLFYLAGHETSASTLSFALYQLGRHPEAQREARQEARQALEGYGDEGVPLEALDRLPYVTAVLKETLRMFPPATAITPRVCPAGGETLHGYRIPEGAIVAVSVYALHHDPSQWPEPARFMPERFLGAAKHHPFAWMPFSAGPRQCIGTNFAWMEMRAVLALILRSFEWEVPPGFDLKFKRSLTLRPYDGIPLIMRSADAAASM